MQLGWNRTFKTRKGQAIVFDQESKTPVTLADCCLIALDNENIQLDGIQKYKRYQLSRKIETALDEIRSVDFTAEELSELKTAVGQFPFVTVLHGQLWDALDGKKEDDAAELKVVK